MVRYDVFEKLAQLMVLTKTDRGYCKFVQTGRLSLYDYDRGFLEVNIGVYKNMAGMYQLSIWVLTVDDGDFGGSVFFAEEQDAIDLMERVAREVFEDMVAFPSDGELNHMLRPYGIFLTYV